MASPLTARLDKLEEKLPAQRKQQRVIRVIVRHDGDAGPVLAAQGYDPDNDFAIIRRIVAAPKPGTVNGMHPGIGNA
jgi:hypothetical protein